MGNLSGVSHLADVPERLGLCCYGSVLDTNSVAGGIMITDPVCGMTLDEKKKSEFQMQFAGRKYFFCSEECRKEFEADPGGYVETAAA
jgi:YHS domain-containing protein